jgi:dienelactone hydrolase
MSRWAPRGAWVLASLAVGGIAGTAWLLRDPEPYFLERRSAIAVVDTAPVVVANGVAEQDVTIHGENGFAVHLAVRRPAAVDSVRRPLYLILGGHQRGRSAGALLGDTRGNVYASLEYPFDGNDRAKGLALVTEVPAIRRALYDTPPAVMLALDYLLQRADVDPTRVELVGASFGAPFATIAAALDVRVTRLWIAHGGGEPYTLFEHGLRPEIGFRPARVVVAGLATLLASGPRLAPEHWVARVSPRPVVMLNAEDDERIPRRSVDALWDAAREPRTQLWLPGQHMQGNRPEVLERLVQAMVDHAAAADTGIQASQ